MRVGPFTDSSVINLVWDASTDDVGDPDHLDYRLSMSRSPFQVVAESTGGMASHTVMDDKQDLPLQVGETLAFKVSAFNSADIVDTSSDVTSVSEPITVSQVPDPPTDV